jgi:hypothetical protein
MTESTRAPLEARSWAREASYITIPSTLDDMYISEEIGCWKEILTAEYDAKIRDWDISFLVLRSLIV